ncbi:MAG: homoserine kinase [Elusimicrobia bacterium CG11_big_fil_rev_8_21_14_0_20_64_6]|nr:MAG: homoserine kinase [Elusimicrobia bacterium CG11_big_fil_rev_8_21_14_0_20_64_6]
MTKVLSRVTVTVPASTSNLGPGFDCLGLALDLRNELTLELIEGSGSAVVEMEGEGAKTLPRGESNMLVKAARLILPKRLPGRLVFKSVNRIPLARGLGSSAAAAVAGLWAGAHLFGTLRRSEDELESMAVKLEGHPDNVAPCVHGGLTASLLINGRSRAHRLNIHPAFSAVIGVPDFQLTTRRARAALPKKVPMADAVFNIAHAILLVRALETGRTRGFDTLMSDRLHQPYRARLVPGLVNALAAAVKSGAAGAALSGSGPAVFALIEGDIGRRVGEAMRRAFAAKGVKSHALELSVDRQGVRVER